MYKRLLSYKKKKRNMKPKQTMSKAVSVCDKFKSSVVTFSPINTGEKL